MTTHSYDEFGRLTHSSAPAEETTYTWDALGHLSQIASGDATATYSYGISGMRERKSVVTASGTKTTESVWSGMQLLAERDSDGTTYEYVYGAGVPLELVVTPGPGLTGAGIAKRYAYQTDAGGSVIGITDASGAEIARYAYDPYGNPTATSGTDPLAARNPLRYRGYYYDAETGLYYLPARYYEPRSARFLSVDPAAPSAGDAATINRYAYCAGDPVGASDPTGAVADYDGDGKASDTDYAVRIMQDSFARQASGTWVGSPRHRQASRVKDKMMEMLQMGRRNASSRGLAGAMRRVDAICQAAWDENREWSASPEFKGWAGSFLIFGSTDCRNGWRVCVQGKPNTFVVSEHFESPISYGAGFPEAGGGAYFVGDGHLDPGDDYSVSGIVGAGTMAFSKNGREDNVATGVGLLISGSSTLGRDSLAVQPAY